VIAILIIVIVYAVARVARAMRMAKELVDRFGIREIFRVSTPRSAPLRRVTVRELLKPKTYDEYLREVEALITRAVSLGEFGPRTKLSEACEHALKGGKRLRPIILMEIARAVSLRRMSDSLKSSEREPVTPVDPADAALFIEYMHSASLIVDDLPAFDNDVERRGRPTVHAMSSPAVAQMAAISLISSAFQNICRQIDWIRDNCPDFKNVDRIGTKLCNDISRAIGVFGAAGGQYMDVSTADQLFAEYGPEAVMDLMYKKTATFFEISAVTGWLIAGGGLQSLEDIRSAGKHLGIAFQIADDIGDMESDAERRKAGKPGFNIAHEIWRDEAVREMERNLRAARLNLERLQLWSELWAAIEQKVLGMAGSSDVDTPEQQSGPGAQGSNLQARRGARGRVTDGNTRVPSGIEGADTFRGADSPVDVVPVGGGPGGLDGLSDLPQLVVDGDEVAHEADIR
jgi:geranylgeranyl diphosphate synthase type II